ncbi:hypothetical protein EOD43_17215 [Sphingomonas crocodyli]|uniref:DUF3108 domain-containing protein n=2 Tax=Sphingomonas crocodyli TaxID=1979270 RepID=A0A437M0L2_9SPHN|nr:hypothetical protein EOD43_17215 [Sphingomonas crocodyli]
MFIAAFAAMLTVTAVATPLSAAPIPLSSPSYSYADIADLALGSPLVAGVEVVKAERLKGELAPGLQPGFARFLITAGTKMLLRGADGMPGVITYLVDVPLDAKGRAPTLKKVRVIVLAERVVGRPQEIRLSSPHSQIAWTPEIESKLRAILTESVDGKAPPRVTGITGAFYSPGAIAGESESQIFLATADKRPISLSVLRRPGEQTQWSVATGEIVDDSATIPQRDTLIWYRLACFLPKRIPAKALAQLSDGDAQAVQQDYIFVLEQLGACNRTIR